MPAPSLVDSCTRACIKNIRGLTDVGDVEYWRIRTVLQRIDSPEQLHQIELCSPQIKGEDAELWRTFISREIPNWRTKNYSPKNPTKWYEVYCKYKKEQRIEIERDEEILRQQMGLLKKEKETHVSKVVELRKLPKVPRDPRMHANNGGVPIGRGKGFAKPGASTLMWNAGSRTKTSDAQSVLTKARREAKEISQRGKLSRPSHQLSGRVGQVKKAPAGMVNEYRKAAEPPVRILSKRRNIVGIFQGGISGPSLEDREKRLRALTMSGGAGSKRDASGLVKETLVGSSDDDEDDLDELDELFDDKKLQSRPSAASASKTSLPTSKSPPSRPQSAASATSKALPQPIFKGRPAAASTTPKVSSSSPPLGRPNPKPSDIGSSNLPKTHLPPSSSLQRLSTNPPIPRSRSSSPGHGESRPPPMMQRRRVEVDIFARPKKKPRAR